MLDTFRRTLPVALALAVLGLAAAQAQEAGTATLFQNVRVFDGKGVTIGGPADVLVVGNRIARISTEPIEPEPGTTVVVGEGRTLMPGLIDAHTHVGTATIGLREFFAADPAYAALEASRAAEDMLMRGFTSARDMGGPIFGLKRAIDEGMIPGPRIWPAGAMLSQTGGHGEFRTINELPWFPGMPLHVSERVGFERIADGPDAVMRAVREQLLLGASQIKLLAGGGVASPFDPLDVTQYTEAEIAAAVTAAANWGTYVTVHAYTPPAMQQAIRSGVKCIEHGHLADEETARMMAERGIWWSLQPFLAEEGPSPYPEGSPSAAKHELVVKGTDTAYALAKKHGVKTAFGTDIIFDAEGSDRQGVELAKLVRWYTPGEVLKMATGDNAELLALSGPRNPYPGKLGVVEEGALADLILVDGDPVADLALVEDPEANFLVIMKDGEIYKNTTP
jgi:imidazolonepropionase-like amidohydrolase